MVQVQLFFDHRPLGQFVCLAVRAVLESEPLSPGVHRLVSAFLRFALGPALALPTILGCFRGALGPPKNASPMLIHCAPDDS